MRLDSIINLGMNYLKVGIVLVLAIAILFAVNYFLIYKKLLKGTKKLNKRKLALSAVYFCYFILVVGAVLLDRGSHYYSAYDLQLFNSYLDAWNSFSKVAWRPIILNIIMFVPIGILLPLWSEKLKTFWKAFAASIAMTFIIEFCQLLMKRGIFELDDIFDNTLGAVIGYCLIMIIFLLRKDVKKKGLKVAACLSPLLLTLGTFLGIFAIYNNQEFGNLEENYTYKQNMKGITVTSEVAFDDKGSTAEVFSSKVATKEEAYDFAEKFFGKFSEEIDDSMTDVYDDTIIYYSKDRFTSIWIDFKGFTYSFSKHREEEKNQETTADENKIKSALKDFGIDVPEKAVFKAKQGNCYSFEVSKTKVEEELYDGILTCEDYNDGTISRIDNKIIEYKPVKDCEIISEAEAYNHIKEGKFKNCIYTESMNNEAIKSIDVQAVKLDYISDSKGFFQPVYRFDISVNDVSGYIIIPALKN